MKVKTLNGNLNIIGKNLKKYRALRGLSQPAICRKLDLLGVTMYISDIYEIETPITSLSYDNEFGYYVAPEDIEAQIKDTISQNDYDHIFIVMRLRR